MKEDQFTTTKEEEVVAKTSMSIQEWMRKGSRQPETPQPLLRRPRLFEQLRQRGLFEETLILVTSDHGEEFFEHGSMGHGTSLFDELIRVPLVIKPPASWGTAPSVIRWAGRAPQRHSNTPGSRRCKPGGALELAEPAALAVR